MHNNPVYSRSSQALPRLILSHTSHLASPMYVEFTHDGGAVTNVYPSIDTCQAMSAYTQQQPALSAPASPLRGGLFGLLNSSNNFTTFHNVTDSYRLHRFVPGAPKNVTSREPMKWDWRPTNFKEQTCGSTGWMLLKVSPIIPSNQEPT